MTPLLTWNMLYAYLGIGLFVTLFGCAVRKVFFKEKWDDLDGDDIGPILLLAFLWPIAIPIGVVLGALFGVYMLFVYVLTCFKQAYIDNGCKK